MQTGAGSKIVLLLYTSSIAICSLIVLGGMLLSPSEPGNILAFGLSLPRLVMAAGFLFMFLLFSGLTYKAVQDPGWAEKILDRWFGGGRLSRWLAWFTAIALALGWVGCFLPASRAGLLGPYWTRIQPVMIFILAAGVATLTVFLLKRGGFSSFRPKVSGIFRLSFVLFLVSLLVLSWMLYSKFGIYSPEDFWYGAGVPILASQTILAILAGMLFLLFGRNHTSRRSDAVVFILIYLVTALLWSREPLQGSFLFSDPRPPNDTLYPFADSAAFDAGSQFALIGQGIYIFNNPFTDRPLYLSLLVYLHSIFGQNYELMMAAQAAIFAVLPGLIYLIGRSLDMRAVGFASAVVATLRGVNAIAGSNMIDLANPKMILSDFPAAIGVALIVLVACEWLKIPEQRWHFAIWLGGAIGLTLMIRPHALVILFLIPFYALLRFTPQWKRWLLACLLIVVGVVAITLPWELRNVSRGGIMYRPIVTKIQDVIRTRYITPDEQGRSPQPEQVLSTFTLQSGRAILSLYQPAGSMQEQSCSSLLCFAPKHFLHNTITSILSLPTSPILEDLRNTVRGEQSYWRADWQGTLTPSALVFLVLNVFFILLGISAAWKHQRLAGLAPLAVFVMYNLSNSVARTSGGRYIVPADWIVPLYFVAGILFLFREIAGPVLPKQPPFFDPEPPSNDRTNLARSPMLTILMTFSLLFVMGSLIPLSEKLHSPRYADFDFSRLLESHEAQITQAGLGPEEIQQFLKDPGSEVLVGRTLYPRSYRLGQGEVSFYFYPYTIMDFPRTGFFLVGPNGQDSILLPGRTPERLPHAADALVIGCREQNYVDALMVIILDEAGAAYIRSPMPALTCPLPKPVCENNNECE